MLGMAAQFTLTNSPDPYSEFAWIHWGSVSFPVPPSPFSNTGMLVRHIFSARARTRAIAVDWPKSTCSGGVQCSRSELAVLVEFSPGIWCLVKKEHIMNQTRWQAWDLTAAPDSLKMLILNGLRE